MSFTIDLMKNNSDVNVLNKDITTLMSISGTLKARTSIINPVIVIDGTLPTDCNYMYISEFGRYYYVNDITSINNDLFEISGHVDVLKTYASQIRASRGIIARQQTNWNLYVDDGVFKTYQNEQILLKQFTGGFTTQDFVLAVAGH